MSLAELYALLVAPTPGGHMPPVLAERVARLLCGGFEVRRRQG